MSNRVYIAGPMSGHEALNFPAFFNAQAKLESLGYTVYNPAEEDMKYNPNILDEDITDEVKRLVMRHDIHLIMDRVDMLVLLPGWESSRGALLEYALADFLDIPCRELKDGELFVTIPSGVLNINRFMCGG